MAILRALVLLALAVTVAAEPILPDVEEPPSMESEWQTLANDAMEYMSPGTFVGETRFGDLVCVMVDLSTLTLFCGIIPEPVQIYCRIVPGGITCADWPMGSLRPL